MDWFMINGYVMTATISQVTWGMVGGPGQSRAQWSGAPHLKQAMRFSVPSSMASGASPACFNRLHHPAAQSWPPHPHMCITPNMRWFFVHPFQLL